MAQCRPFEIHYRPTVIAKLSEMMSPIEGKESSALPRVLLVDDHEAMLMRAAGVLKTSCTSSAPLSMATRGSMPRRRCSRT